MEFYHSYSNNFFQKEELSELQLLKKQIAKIEKDIDQINSEINYCTNRFQQLKEEQVIAQVPVYCELNLEYEVDDALMEITQDLMDSVLKPKEIKYTTASMNFLNRLISTITNRKFSCNSSSEDATDSLLIINKFESDNRLNYVELLRNYELIQTIFNLTEEDIKYAESIEEDKINSENPALRYLIMFYKSYISRCASLKIHPEMKELRDDIVYLEGLSKEKQEALRRVLIQINEMVTSIN